jgi:hypothetical protein
MSGSGRKLAGAALIAAFCLSCAGTEVTKAQDRVGGQPLPRPPVLLVYTFAVSPEDVVVDTFGPSFLPGSGSQDERTKRGREVAEALATSMVAKTREKGIAVERANPSAEPPLDAIVVKGQFLTVDEGDRTGRMTIGFGTGGSKLRVRVQAYQAGEWGLVRLRQAEAETTPSKKPGMAVPVAGGAAMGTAAASAVVSGGMNIVTEARGGLEGDADDLAKLFAERVEAFYRQQGWL